MALALFDRVQETTTTTGTGSVTLAGAVPGFQSFAVVGNGNTCYYTIVDGSAWEVGIGTYSTSGPTLARTTVLSNSSGNTSPITLAAGTKSIFLTYPAEKSVNLDASDNVSPLGTVSSGVWQGSTVGVAYGGTGVTASSGANSVVLRDGSQNIAVNRVNQSNTNTTAAGGTTALSAASSYIHTLVGTGGQTYTLPDATTLTTGVAFVFNNLATGTLTIANYAGTTIGTIPSGGAGAVFLTLNSTVGGTWDLHAYLPEGVTFGTNAFNLGTSIISGGTWQGGTIQTAYGGTGLTSYTSGGAVYANSSSTLTSGTLPLTAGGTAATTASGARTSLDVPSTTGSGASGTWGISVTGNSATATLLKAINVTSTSISNWNPGGLTYQAWGQGFTNSAISGDSGDITLWLRPSVYTGGGTELNMYIDGDYYSGTGAFRVLNAGNFNTYAPTLTGGGASGTWGINISGNAATATNQSGGTVNATSITSTGQLVVNLNIATPPANYYNALQQEIRATSGTAGIGLHRNGFSHCGIYHDATDTLKFNMNSGTVTLNASIGTVIGSGNYNSYAPTLTGGGASGTWNINISGNAATATSATDNTKLPLAGGTMTGNILFADSGTTKRGIQGISGTNDYWFIGGGATAGNSGFMEIATGDDAQTAGTSEPIYVSQYGPGDPLTGTLVRRGSLLDANGNTSFPGSLAFNGTIPTGASSNLYIGRNLGATNYNAVALNGNSSDSGNMGLTGGGSGDATLYINSPGNIVLRTSSFAYSNTISSFAQFAGSTRSPIFYDSDNTSYYVDPASTSFLVTLNTTNYFSVNTGRAANEHGYAANFISSQSAISNYVPFNFTSTLGNHSWGQIARFRIDQAGGDRPSIQFSTGASETRWAVGYCYFDDNFRITQNMGMRNDGGNDGWGTERLQIDTGGNVYMYASARSPIFYDQNNTGYYGDFAGTSSLNGLSVSTINSRGTGNLMFYQGFTLDANTMETNATGFTYSVNAPATGPVARFSTGGGYDMWLNASYNGTGPNLFFRTRNGDTATINPWRAIPSYGVNANTDSLFATIFYDSNNTAYYADLGSTAADCARFAGGIHVSVGNVTGQGIILADDGDIVDLNDGYCAMRFSSGVRIHSGNRSGGAVILLSSGGSITASNNITAYGSASDRRLKENIQPLTGALDKVMQLQGCTFDWKEDSEQHTMVGLREDIGFIADAVQDVVPTMVREGKDGYLSLRDRGFSALLVEAMKEQQAQIAALRAEINALRAH
jgi:hypothetical protein